MALEGKLSDKPFDKLRTSSTLQRKPVYQQE